jgi:hypothetical protein
MCVCSALSAQHITACCPDIIAERLQQQPASAVEQISTASVLLTAACCRLDVCRTQLVTCMF